MIPVNNILAMAHFATNHRMNRYFTSMLSFTDTTKLGIYFFKTETSLQRIRTRVIDDFYDFLQQ